jgi:hypothetical protein
MQTWIWKEHDKAMVQDCAYTIIKCGCNSLIPIH